MTYITPEYNTQLTELAERLVTPERYGRIALSEIPVEDLRFTDEPLSWD